MCNWGRGHSSKIFMGRRLLSSPDFSEKSNKKFFDFDSSTGTTLTQAPSYRMASVSLCKQNDLVNKHYELVLHVLAWIGCIDCSLCVLGLNLACRFQSITPGRRTLISFKKIKSLPSLMCIFGINLFTSEKAPFHVCLQIVTK